MNVVKNMKLTETPLVSILINNFNYSQYVSCSIDSALHQTYPNIEVIVVDDGSTDDSKAVIEGYGNRIHAVFKENGGQASAFNAGFAASKGEIICFLDSDDYFSPHKVDTLVQALQENPNCQWLIHRMDHVDNEGQPIEIEEKEEEERLLKATGDYRQLARYKKIPFILPATTALAFKRELLEEIMPVPQDLRITADNYLKFASLIKSPVVVCDQVLSSQRIHGNNLYTNIDRSSKVFRKKSREINYAIAKALGEKDPYQLLSLRFLFGVFKSALRDMDLKMVGKAPLTSLKVIGYSIAPEHPSNGGKVRG